MAFTFTPPSMPGLSPAYALNQNPCFNIPFAGPAVPPRWSDWINGAAGAYALDSAGVPVLTMTGPAGANAGVLQALTSAVFPGAGWYVMEAEVSLVSGALTGAGMLCQFDTDNSFATTSEFTTLTFSTDPAVNGVAPGVGLAGTTYIYRKLIRVKLPISVSCVIYAMAHYSGLGAITGANQLDWYSADIRPATLAEIAAGNAQYGLPVFPVLPGQAIAVSKAPRWSTKVKRAASGRERRTALWPYPLWQFELSYEVVRQRPSNDELAALWEFFNTVQGQYAPFLFLDPTDYQSPNVIAAGPTGFGTGDGSTKTFQISRYLGVLTPAGYPGILEPVYAPFGANIYINGTLQSSGYAFSANGLITFSTAPSPGATLTWGGYFYFGCRFLQDDLTFEQLVSQLWSGKSVKFTSLRV